MTYLVDGIAQKTSPRLNEVMSLNVSTKTDNDGDTPDWIEIFNASDATIQMEDYYLSDDSDDLKNGIFPGLNYKQRNSL